MTSKIVRGLFALALFLSTMGLVGFLGAGISALFGTSLDGTDEPVRRVLLGSGLMFIGGILSGLIAFLFASYEANQRFKRRFPD